MKKVISVLNRKGGIGKTVTAHAFASCLTELGKRVLLVDLDSQGNLTYDMGVVNAPITAMDMLTRAKSVQDCIYHGRMCDIICAGPSLADADIVINQTGKEYRLRECLEEVQKKYDYIIIDTPAALNTLTVNALTASNDVIIPAQAEIHSIQGIGQLSAVISEVKRYCNHELNTKGILLTIYEKNNLAKDMRAAAERMAETLGTKVFETPIRKCNAIKEAETLQKSILEYKPKSHAAEDYRAVVQEYLKMK